MENKNELKTEIGGTPQPLNKEMKLKVIAVVSLHNSLNPIDLVKEGKVTTTLMVTYSQAEAVMFTKQSVAESIAEKGVNLNPEDFMIPTQMVTVDADKMIDFNSIPMPAVVPVIETKEEKIKKSKEEMVAYVRYVFDKAGSPNDRDVAELVIKEFLTDKGL